MSQLNALDPLALLENLDGWVLGCLEDELSRDDAWQAFAKNITTGGGIKIYSVSDLSRLKQSSRPAADIIQGLIQRGLSLANLLQLLQQTNLTHLYSILAPKEVARITGQSHEGVVAVRPGGSVTVTVSVAGNPPPQIVWYRGDTPLLHCTAHSLTLPVFGPQDEGVYLCLVRQQVPPDSPQWGQNAGPYLELWSDPIELCMEDIAPSFSVQPADVMLDCGQKLRLTCECDGAHPPPLFSWYKDGLLVVAADIPSLTIESVGVSNSGQYWCVATNAVGQATSRRCTVTVSEVVPPNCEPPVVVRQPRVWSTEGVVSRGQPVQLWCTVRSAVPVTFAWTRNGHVLHGTSSSCHSTMSSQEDEGDIYSSCLLYTILDSDPSVLRLLCVISNSAGQVVSREAVVQVKELDLAPRVYTAGRKWALLVGNCRYEGKPLLTTLPDCQRIAATLTQLGFRCLVLADLSLSHFRNAVSLLCAFVQRGDYVMFYYGGHGYHDSGDRMIAVDGCEGPTSDERAEEAGLRAGCLSPVWVRNVLLRPQPAMLFIVLDMCRTTLPHVGSVSAPTATLQEELPNAARCSVVLHGTSVRCAALEAPDSMSVLTKHLLRRLASHASQPLTSLASAVLQDVCGDSTRVREQQFPVLEADLAMPRALADCPTAPAGAVVERWKRMLGVGDVVAAEVWIPLAFTQETSAPLSNRDERQETDSDTKNNSKSGCSTQGDRDDSFEKKFEAYMAEELEGLNISKKGFIRRNNCEKSCGGTAALESETLELHDGNFKRDRVPLEMRRQFTKHQLSTTVCPELTDLVLKRNKVSGTRVHVRGRASLLSGDHPVANIALVRVALDFAGPPVLHRVALEALGCRLVRVTSEQPWLTVYRVEDLHCLAAPLMVTVTFPSSVLGGKINLNARASASSGAENGHMADAAVPSFNNLSGLENCLNSPLTRSNVNTVNAFQKNLNLLSGSSVTNHGEQLDSSESKIVRLCLGLPGLAKTNLQVNDLRGTSLEETDDAHNISKIGFDYVNITA